MRPDNVGKVGVRNNESINGKQGGAWKKSVKFGHKHWCLIDTVLVIEAIRSFHVTISDNSKKFS